MPTLRARTSRVGGALSTPVANARLTWPERHALLLQLEDEAGRIGQGEAAPLPGMSVDTLEDVTHLLERMDWSALAPRLDGDPLPFVRAAVSGLPSPAARFAAETALLDSIGHRRGLPLQALLGDAADARRPISALLHGPATELLAEARAAGQRGIGTLKRKIGAPGAFADELRQLTELRGALGPSVRLRLDANGALPIETADAQVAALARLGVELLEEPVPAARLRELSPAVPVAIDESLIGATPEALEAWLAGGRVSALVLKPTLLGGLLACLDLAAHARTHQVACVLTHAFEGPIALAACASLALALPAGPFAHGLDRHPGLIGWPGVTVPQLDGAELRSVALPGLGLRIVEPR